MLSQFMQLPIGKLSTQRVEASFAMKTDNNNNNDNDNICIYTSNIHVYISAKHF